jgi:hypothetical protein
MSGETCGAHLAGASPCRDRRHRAARCDRPSCLTGATGFGPPVADQAMHTGGDRRLRAHASGTERHIRFSRLSARDSPPPIPVPLSRPESTGREAGGSDLPSLAGTRTVHAVTLNSPGLVGGS